MQQTYGTPLMQHFELNPIAQYAVWQLLPQH
jgi:hypothetical protein